MHKVRPNDHALINYKSKYSTLTQFAKILGVPRRTLNDWYHEAKSRVIRKTSDGNYRTGTYIISSAQINTPVHEKFLTNIKVLARERDATILIAGITYNVHGQDHEGTGDALKKKDSNWFDAKIRKYLCNNRVKLNDKIEWLGNLNILPTAVNPISGYQTFTGLSSAIIPHPKIALESVATASTKLAKFLTTTGSITVPNYMQKNAGIKGEFHHQIGAVIVEVVSDKQFHIRHVLAEPNGTFYDLTDRYCNGRVAKGHRVDAIVWGDIHSEDIDPQVFESSWGREGLIDVLKPKYQFFHDLLDFKYRNHHNRHDDLWMKKFGDSSVKGEIVNCTSFLNDSYRDWCHSVVVASNHDNAYTRWVKETTHHEEPDMANALFLLESQLQLYSSAYESGNTHLLKWACGKLARDQNKINKIVFLDEDVSFPVGNVECGMHGDKGINGSKGSIKSFAKIGTKCSIGHSHTAGIFEGVYQAGCSRTLQAGYNPGASSWSHSHIIQYPNGKRTILTLINGKYYNTPVTEAT